MADTKTKPSKKPKPKPKPKSVIAQLHTTSAEHPQHSAFSIHNGSVWYQPEPKIVRGEPQEQRPVEICSELRITARTRDDSQRNHGRLLEFRDDDGHLKTIPIPMSELQGDGLEVRKKLADEGLRISAYRNARTLLTNYISDSKPDACALCVDRTGWYNHLFVLPDKSIGSNGTERCLFQPKQFCHETGIGQHGDLQQWQTLSAMCPGNSRLVFAVSAAFAGPLLSLVDMESGGFNFYGESSRGKTTALLVGCSVYGSPLYRQQWRSTVNGLEAICLAHNDCLLILDEMGEMEARDLGKSCYMVANGQGKIRANATTTSKWRTLILSSAEKTLSQFVSETGRPVNAGQCVRLIDIPGDAGAGHGLFENLHGYPNGSQFSEALKERAKHAYGVPIINYLNELSRRIDRDKLGLIDEINQFKTTFINDYVADNADGQVRRGADRFALVAYAGEHATELGITGWQPGEAKKSAVMCFHAWLDHRGGAGSQEERAILEQVRYFFQKYFDSGFVYLTDTLSNPPFRTGFKHKLSDGSIQFWVLREIFREEISNNYDPKLVAKYCISAGYLVPDSEGKSTQNQKIPVIHGDKPKSTRVYVFSDQVMD